MKTTIKPMPTTDPVSIRLTQARTERHLSIDEVAAHTRISRSNLRAIEEGAYDRLPADSFTRGLVQLYGNFLGLDGRELAATFFVERDGGHPKPLTPLQKCRMSQALEPKKLAEQTRISSAWSALILLACITCSFSAFCLYYSWNPFAYLTDRAFYYSSKVKSSFHPADPATSTPHNQTRLSLQAVFHQDCGVRAVIDDQPSSEQQYLKGSTILWEAQQSLHLSFSQANCAELLYNGDPLTFPPLENERASLFLPPSPTHGP